MPDQEKPASGELIIGLTADGQNVLINHPDLLPDAEGCGHIVFSPDQATTLAGLLFKKANIARGVVCGNCGDLITQEGGWATALVRYCFKDECQQEFYKEAQAMVRAVDPETADRLAEATKPKTFTCPKCGAVSHNPNDVKEKYCGACHEFK
jgi:predicted RNA-binding Zn-ribbon protein involved in translation (DUF1610 family)